MSGVLCFDHCSVSLVNCGVYRGDCLVSLAYCGVSLGSCIVFLVVCQMSVLCYGFLVQCCLCIVTCSVSGVSCGGFRVHCVVSRGSCGLYRVSCCLLKDRSCLGWCQYRIIVMIGECTSPFAEVCKTEAVELKARPAERETSRPIEKAARRGPRFFFSSPTLQKPGMAVSRGSQRRS